MKRIFPCLLLLSLVLSAGDIGMVQSRRIEIPGDKLEAVPVDEFAPAIVRAETVGKTDTGYIYEIDFVGLEPGEYDVTTYLRAASRAAPSVAPHIVAIERKLPASFRGEIATIPRRLGLPPAWYKLTAMILAVLWVLCLPALIFLGRRNVQVQEQHESVGPTLEERLAALLEGMGGEEGKEAWQKLEATLIQYLTDSRQVSVEKAFDQLLALKKDAIAGPVIREFEQCLHAPGGRRRESLDHALIACARVMEGHG